MMVHLHPLPTGLHGEDQARIWFAQSITVWNAFTAQLEFHFRQIRTTEQAKRVSCWFVDVTHGWRRTGILWIRMPNKFFGKWKLWVMIYLNSIQFDLFCVNILVFQDALQKPGTKPWLNGSKLHEYEIIIAFLNIKRLLSLNSVIVFAHLILFYIFNL